MPRAWVKTPELRRGAKIEHDGKIKTVATPPLEQTDRSWNFELEWAGKREDVDCKRHVQWYTYSNGSADR